MPGSPDFFLCGPLYTDRRADAPNAMEFKARMIDIPPETGERVAYGVWRVVGHGWEGQWSPIWMDENDFAHYHITQTTDTGACDTHR